MPPPPSLLPLLTSSISSLLALFQNPAIAKLPINDHWSTKDLLAHLTFWHESFARNLDDLVHDRPPRPLKGRLSDLNQQSVESMRSCTLEILFARFQAAQAIIEQNILSPKLTLIPYRTGSRPYSPAEHLQIVTDHIQGHTREIKKALARSAKRQAPQE